MVPKGGFGNLIALPFQGQAQKNGNTLFVDGQFVPYPDQWAFLSTLPRVTPEQLTACLHKLCSEGRYGRIGRCGGGTGTVAAEAGGGKTLSNGISPFR